MYHRTFKQIAVGSRWLRERKQRVDEGGTAGDWLEAMLVPETLQNR